MMFHLSLKVPGKGAHPFPQQVPMESDAPSQDPMVYSFIYICQSPQNVALSRNGKNIQSPSTEPHADRRPTYNGVRLGSPRGSLTTLLLASQCHAAFNMIPSTLVGVDTSPVSQRVSRQPSTLCSFHICYSLPHDTG